MIRRPPRSTLDRSSAASDVYKRQVPNRIDDYLGGLKQSWVSGCEISKKMGVLEDCSLSLIHISEPTRPY